MKIRRTLSSVFVASLTGVLLAACGGGGGGSAPQVVPTLQPGSPVSTPAPGSLIVPGQQSSGGGAGGFQNNGNTPSTYAITSNPSGQTFVLYTGTTAGTSGTAPTTITPTPPPANSPLSIVFTGGYTVPITQVYDGPHTVFYNAASDSSGAITVSSLQSIKRSLAAVKAPAVRTPQRLRVFPRSAFSDVDPTRVAVRYSAAALQSSGRKPAAIEAALDTVGTSVPSATSDVLRVVNVPSGMSAASFTHELQGQREVAEVTPMHRRRILSRAAITPPDAYYNNYNQWYSFATGQNFAWAYSTGSGAKLAVIDTGVDNNNTDITANLIYEESDVTAIDPTTCVSSPSATTTTTVGGMSAQDDNGHGTNVMGIAVSASNSVGFVGAAYGASLLAYKIFPNQTADCSDDNNNAPGSSTADEAAAIKSAVAQGADVISMSIGGASFDTVEFNAVESAIEAGVTVVAAAGNSDDGSQPGALDYPAAYPGVIAVGASALKDQYYDASGNTVPAGAGTYGTSTEFVAPYSQYGPSLAIVAPGGDAPSCLTGPNASSPDCDDDYLHWIFGYSTSTAYATKDTCSTEMPATDCLALFNGTSQATPQAAATAALLIAEAGGHRALSPAQVLYSLESTADNINDPHQGHGRLNAYRALASLIRDTAAYSGPQPQAAGTAQLIAFAYNVSGTNKPTILDATFPAGVPVATDGTFRIADVPAATGTYKVAVWYDANGDGVIDAGDQIGVSSATCNSTSKCALGTITMGAVSSGYVLP